MKKALVCLGGLSLASGKIYFSETFGDDWESRWVKSTWKDKEGTTGKFALTAGKYFTDEKEDKGLQTAEDSKFFAISAAYDSFSNEGKTLIVQYQVKYEKDIECGGAYLKLGPKMKDQTQFGDPTEYNIMFGPDKCGYNKRTHLIFNYADTNHLKKEDLLYKQGDNDWGISHLYRMVLKPDNTVRVEVDEEKIYEGNLKEDWAVLGDKEIVDPSDSKPGDWVEEAMMDDPSDKKPDNWVEEKRIVDAEAKKPDDWDDAEDGEWEPPMKDNPAYKGDWSVKRISNPVYKGVWEAKKINNPDYKDDDSVYKYKDFGFIGIDLWQVKGGTIFDNIIICDDKAEADAFAAKWKTANAHEKAEVKKAEDSKKDEDKKKEDSDDDDDLAETKKEEA